MGLVEECKEEEEELTEEQKERIKLNREHALSIRRKREFEQRQTFLANINEGCSSAANGL